MSKLSRLEKIKQYVNQTADARRHNQPVKPPGPVQVDFEGLASVICTGEPGHLNRPMQHDFIMYTGRIGLFMGPVGTAKTTTVLTKDILAAILYPGSMWGVFRENQWTLYAPGGVVDTFIQCVGHLGPDVIISKHGGGSDPLFIEIATVNTRTGGAGVPSTFIFHGLNDLDKLGTTMFNGISVHEANEIQETMAAKLNERLRHKRPDEPAIGPARGPFFLSFECNPVTRSHWIHKRFCADGDDCWPVPWGRKFKPHRSENEANLPPGYYEEIAKGYTPEMFVRYVEGECGPDPAGEPVFGQEFNQLLHVRKIIYNPRLLFVRSWDFGRRRPGLVIAQIHPEGWVDRLYATVGQNEIMPRFRDRMLMTSAAKFPGVATWIDFCDPHGTAKKDTSEKSSIDYLIEGGIKPIYRDTEIEYGLGLMTLGLTTMVRGRPRSMFNEGDANMLIEGYAGGYKWPELKIGTNNAGSKRKPVADGFYEHPMDCDRYIEVNLRPGATKKRSERRVSRRIMNSRTGY
jgi:hypothetical protein